VNLAHVFR